MEILYILAVNYHFYLKRYMTNRLSDFIMSNYFSLNQRAKYLSVFVIGKLLSTEVQGAGILNGLDEYFFRL